MLDLINLWWLVLVVGVCAVFTGIFRKYALRTNLVDHPNARSSHDIPTPRGGGVAVVTTFLGCAFVLWYGKYILLQILLILLGGGGLVALIGFVDDHHPLPARLRFGVHLVAAVLILAVLPLSPVLPLFSFEINFGWFGCLLAVFALVWLLNLYNFMDGIDGLAGQETIMVAGGAALIIWLRGGDHGHIILLLSLVAATLGFLFWNWPPAKIFMGDACSGFLGISLGSLALLTSVSEAINLWVWLILLAYFIVDASVTLVRRVVRGDKFYEAHRSHAYQILSRRWQSHRKVTLFVLFLNIFWCLPLAVLASYYPYWGAVITLFALLGPTVFVIRIGAGTTNN